MGYGEGYLIAKATHSGALWLLYYVKPTWNISFIDTCGSKLYENFCRRSGLESHLMEQMDLENG